MKEKVFIENIPSGAKVNEAFYVEEKIRKMGKSGKPYLHVRLKDKTGGVAAKIWENKLEQLDGLFLQGDFVAVEGIMDTFNGEPQIIINSLYRLDKESVDKDDFMESIGPKNRQTYIEKILQLSSEVKTPYLKQLIDLFLADEEFMHEFTRCPGGKSIHHNLDGGLLKHTAYMLWVARILSKIYKDVDYDILATGVIIHDIGKTRELQSDCSIEYTEEGELVGHLIIGISMLREKIAKIPDFPPNLALVLEHMIASHHYQPEFGAIKFPRFKEALLLHYIDNIDAKMDAMTTSYRKIDDEDVWTDKCFPVENQRLLHLGRFLGIEGSDFTGSQNIVVQESDPAGELQK